MDLCIWCAHRPGHSSFHLSINNLAHAHRCDQQRQAVHSTVLNVLRDDEQGILSDVGHSNDGYAFSKAHGTRGSGLPRQSATFS